MWPWKLIAFVASGVALFLAVHPLAQGGIVGSTGVATHHAPLAEADRSDLLQQLRSARTASQACDLIDRIDGSLGPQPLIEILDRTQLVELRRCATEGLARIDEAPAMAKLEQLLDDADPDVRKQALHGLAASSDRNAQRTVLELALHGTPSQKNAALLALASTGRPEATDLMLQSIESADVETQASLIVALGQTHDPATVPTLTRLVGSSHNELRITAISALGRIGDDASITVLARSLLAADSGRVAHAAAQALSSIEDPSARAALVQAATHGSRAATSASLRVLVAYDGPDIRALMLGKLDLSDPNADDACHFFASHPDAAATPRLLELARRSGNGASRGAIAALAKAPGADYPALLVELAGQGGTTQLAAIRGLSELPGGTELARPILIRLLEDGGDGANAAASALVDDKSPVARQALIAALHKGGNATLSVAITLANSHDPDAMKALEDVALSGGQRLERSAAVMALSQAHDPSSEAVLRRLVDDKDPEVRQQALSVLLEGGGEKAEALALAVASSKDAQERMLAVSGLVNSRSPTAIARLSDMTGDKDPNVARTALESLFQVDPRLGAARVQELMHGDVEARRNAIETVGFMDSGAQPILLDAMHDGDEQVVISATEALARMGGHDAQEAIAEVLRSGSTSAAQKKSAADALIGMGAGTGTYRELVERYHTADDEPEDATDATDDAT